MFIIRSAKQRRYVYIFLTGLVFGVVVNTLLILTPFYTTFQRKRIILKQLKITQSPLDTKSNAILHHHNKFLNTTLTQKFLKDIDQKDAQKLSQEVRVLCWVMTTIVNHKKKAIHVKKTWGRHCNILVFISDDVDADLPAIKVPKAKEGRNSLWAKTIYGFTYVNEKYKGQFDWTMKADDDTYLIAENLRKFLLPYSSNEAVYFGFRFKPHLSQGYMSGGSGYVLSRKAVEQVVTIGFTGKVKGCPNSTDNGAEDVNIAKCLTASGVKTGDSRDPKGKHRFLPFPVADHVNPDQTNKGWWYWEYIYWPIKEGYECCSNEAISFHYIPPTMLYMMEYLIYNLTIFSVNNFITAIPPIITTTTTLVPITTQKIITTTAQENLLTTTIQSTSTTTQTTSITTTKIPVLYTFTMKITTDKIINNDKTA